MLGLQAVAGYGQTILLGMISVAIMCSGIANPTTDADATASTNSVISLQACQADGCIFYQSSKLYLYIARMEFTNVLVDDTPRRIDTEWLSKEYDGIRALINVTNYAINFTHCFGNETRFFNISMIFWMDRSNNHWSLVMVTYTFSDEQNRREDYGWEYYKDDYYDDEGGYGPENHTIFTHTYPFLIGTSQNTAYSCDSLAGVSNNSDSELHIYECTMQPFNADAYDPPSNVKDCRGSIADKSDNTGLILGTIAGAAVVITVVIVISTIVYRRRKRGKYNLLD